MQRVCCVCGSKMMIYVHNNIIDDSFCWFKINNLSKIIKEDGLHG